MPAVACCFNVPRNASKSCFGPIFVHLTGTTIPPGSVIWASEATSRPLHVESIAVAPLSPDLAVADGQPSVAGAASAGPPVAGSWSSTLEDVPDPCQLTSLGLGCLAVPVTQASPMGGKIMPPFFIILSPGSFLRMSPGLGPCTHQGLFSAVAGHSITVSG